MQFYKMLCLSVGPSVTRFSNKAATQPIVTIFEKRLTDGPTDGPMDQRTKLLIKSLFATKNANSSISHHCWAGVGLVRYMHATL